MKLCVICLIEREPVCGVNIVVEGALFHHTVCNYLWLPTRVKSELGVLCHQRLKLCTTSLQLLNLLFPICAGNGVDRSQQKSESPKHKLQRLNDTANCLETEKNETSSSVSIVSCVHRPTLSAVVAKDTSPMHKLDVAWPGACGIKLVRNSPRWNLMLIAPQTSYILQCCFLCSLVREKSVTLDMS